VPEKIYVRSGVKFGMKTLYRKNSILFDFSSIKDLSPPELRPLFNSGSGFKPEFMLKYKSNYRILIFRDFNPLILTSIFI